MKFDSDSIMGLMNVKSISSVPWQVFHICVEKNIGISLTEVFVPDQT